MSRADRLAEALEVDALLVTNLVNVRYLTGFTGSNAMAVVGRDVRRFITDFRYVEQAAAQVEGFDRELAPADFVTALAGGWPEGELRLGFEDDHVSVRRHARLREVIPDRIELVPAGGVVERLRAVKEPEEVERIAAAAALVDAVYATVREQGLVGRTEREVALALEDEMRRLGAEEPSFPSIVASSERGALPHARPADVPIERGTLVTLDIGARLDGYCSDCTRTWATGELPDDLAEAYALVLRAQQAGLDAVRPGPRGPRGGRRGARDHRRRRARRALRARPRPRGRARGPRGARGCRAPGRSRWRRATSSPSSRASTCRGAEASGSRISWSSPRTAAACSRGAPKDLVTVD